MFHLRKSSIIIFAVIHFISLAYLHAKDTNGLIILLTDFGTKDFYVGAMKGAVYSIYPEAKIDEISNDVTKYDVAEGARTLLEAAREFPKGTVFLVVIDPGVGTQRKPIAMRTKTGQYFVAPDNGVCTLVIDEFGLEDIRKITNTDVMRKGLRSTTFHGRDIFGPTAAHLAKGFPLEKVGPKLNDCVRLEFDKSLVKNGIIYGNIEFIDEFGNATTNIGSQLLNNIKVELGDHLKVKASGLQEINCKFVKAYADVPKGDYLCLISSTGRLEIAINQGNLARGLKIEKNYRVIISKEE